MTDEQKDEEPSDGAGKIIAFPSEPTRDERIADLNAKMSKLNRILLVTTDAEEYGSANLEFMRTFCEYQGLFVEPSEPRGQNGSRSHNISGQYAPKHP
jgi:hypothetical protein